MDDGGRSRLSRPAFWYAATVALRNRHCEQTARMPVTSGKNAFMRNDDPGSGRHLSGKPTSENSTPYAGSVGVSSFRISFHPYFRAITRTYALEFCSSSFEFVLYRCS